jgi:hypothetical protein
MMYPDPLVHDEIDMSLMALLLLHRGVLESKDILTEVLSLKSFASALYGWHLCKTNR